MSNHNKKVLFAACIVEQGLISLMHKEVLWIDKKKANIVIKIGKGHKIQHFHYFSFIFQWFVKQVINTMAKNIRNMVSITENQGNAEEEKEEFLRSKL